jgi:hypothetical protein
MDAVVGKGLLGFQRALVPAFRCECGDVTYPATSEVELQGWVAIVTLEGGPTGPVPSYPGAHVVVGEGQPDGSVLVDFGKAVNAGLPICRECEEVLEEGLNPYEDGWFCSRCGSYDRHPITRAEIPGLGTITSLCQGAWSVPPAEREAWLREVIVEALASHGLSVDAERLNEPRAFTRVVERMARVIRMIEESHE